MAEKSDVEFVKNWFESYTSSFRLKNSKEQDNINLKIYHSKQVAKEAKNIAASLNLSQCDLFLCEIIGLLHDVGRFPQYYNYKTFVDSRSENHALLGKKVLLQSTVLTPFTREEKDIIIFAVAHHNFKHLPENQSERKILFTKILRDADKLDIFRVVTEYYEKKGGNEFNPVIELDLPVSSKISHDVLEDILNYRLVEISRLKTNTDFKILQLGWTFDINFPYTFLMLEKRGYIKRICSTIPDSEEKQIAYKTVNSFLSRKLS